MINKRIFYVWGYGEIKSRITNICIENWRMMLPNYEIIEINEKTPEWFDFEYYYNNNLWFRTVYDMKLWAYISDFMRVHTIYNNGGIYLDTDITIYKDFGPLLQNRMFIGNCLNNIPELASFGAVKGHPILKKIIEFYEDEIWKSPLYIITQIFTKIIKEQYNIKPNINNIINSDILTIYTPEYLNPYHYSKPFNHKCITSNTYAVHWMSGSWHNKKNLFFLSNKHRIPLATILKQLDFIDKIDKNANKATTIIKLP